MRISLTLILLATALAAVSGGPGLFLGRRSAWGERFAAGTMAVAMALGLVGALTALMDGPPAVWTFEWPLIGDRAGVALDGLSAFFLAPVFLMGGLGPIYGLAYWKQSDHPENGRKARLFWGLMVAGMAVVILARHAMLFLVGWEAMALAAFFLIGTEDHLRETHQASVLYLIATHVGTLCLFAMFCLFRFATGSFDLAPIDAAQAGLGLLTAIFFLALAGFGLKAGLMPLHFWLPSAHANAPTHVSAILSGVLIKMGIYGLVRMLGLLPDPPLVWGVILLGLGAVSGILGVVLALAQHDIKRLLAYHSVENIGIIVMGLGLAMAGRSLGRADWVVLGMAGCLLHVWNHAIFKSLLFLSAGSVIHALHTRNLDRLGGLARRMPWTAALFLIGAVAICGLPPLNGFVSELLIGLGLLRGAGAAESRNWIGLAAGLPVLAMIGALATACFVKVFGAVFLGLPRSEEASHARESTAWMVAPMTVLALLCAGIGLVPVVVAPLLDRAVAAWTLQPPGGGMSLAGLAPLGWITGMGLAGILLFSVLALLLRNRVPRRDCVPGVTWDCGYAQPTPRMQYTATSFAQLLTGLFRRAVHPRIHRPILNGLFPRHSSFSSHVNDPVLDAQILPAFRAVSRWLAQVHWVQQGLAQRYLLYILIVVVLMLVWTVPVGSLLIRLFSR
jgi:hydrogenase-4 component B